VLHLHTKLFHFVHAWRVTFSPLPSPRYLRGATTAMDGTAPPSEFEGPLAKL